VKKISSATTFYLKRIAPLLFVASLVVAIAVMLQHGKFEEMWWLLIVFVLMTAAVGYAFYRRVWSLADEVFDHGDHFVVRRGSVQEKIRLSEVVNVAFRRSQNSRRVVLKLVRPGPFGDEVAFVPPLNFRWNPFAADPLEEDLIRRVDAERRKV
jgi:hypothetical protein